MNKNKQFALRYSNNPGIVVGSLELNSILIPELKKCVQGEKYIDN